MAALDTYTDGGEDAFVAALGSEPTLAAAVEPLRKRLAKALHAAKTPLQRRRRLRESFDALRTLKLAHWLRDSAYPSVPWRVALANAPFLSAMPNDIGAAAAALIEHQYKGNSGALANSPKKDHRIAQVVGARADDR